MADVFISEKEGGARIALAMVPERITAKCGAQFVSFSPLNGGKVQIPTGSSPTEFSWDGTLPGAARKNAGYIRVENWMDPAEIQSMWSVWRVSRTLLQLMVTGTPINHDVYLTDYTATYAGGMGDYTYSISFVQAQDTVIYKIGELQASTLAQGLQEGLQVSTLVQGLQVGLERPEQPPEKTYTVVSGDSLWTIAQRTLGKGGRWGELYDLNRDRIENPRLIYPGQVLTLPG